MEILTLPQFLKLFDSPNEMIIFSEFMQKAHVRSGNNLTPLKIYATENKIDKKDIRLLFENIRNKDEYLTRFYTMSLRIQPEKIHFDTLPPMKQNKMNNNEEVLFKNLIRNIHYRHILQYTESGF